MVQTEAEYNANGEITLKGTGVSGVAWMYQVAQVSDSYIVFKGDYGAGTFAEFEFKGNNMPQIAFFANKSTPRLTNLTNVSALKNQPVTAEKWDSTGIFLTNGFVIDNAPESSKNHGGKNTFKIWGPDRIYLESDGVPVVLGQDGKPYSGFNALINYSVNDSAYEIFTQDGLSKYPNTTFIYNVGTLDVQGKLYIKATLINKDTEEVAGSIYADTGLDVASVGTGKIIAYATVKGTGNDTVFKITEQPYYYGNMSHLMPGEGATFGADGSVTIRGTELKGAGHIGQVADVNNGYVAYSGYYSEYGVGTYIDFEFTGNNMPQVMFFADVINGNMTGYSSFAEGKKTGVRGILSCNGFIPDAGNSSNLNNGGYNTFKIWGANRIYLEDVSGTPIKTGAYAAATANYNYTAKTDDYRIFTQVGLNEMPDTTFRYTVGTCEVNGEVYYEARLTYTDGIEEKTVYIYENTGVSVAELKDAGYGNIVIYGTVKGADKETTFKIVKTPYIGRAALNLPSQGAMMNADGSVTLTGKQINSGAGYASTISDLDNSYIAWEGNYGVGNYITFNFTGNNMPQVTFFANNVNGNMTDFTYTGASANAVKSGTRGNNGILLSNGFYCGGSSNGGTNRFAIFGPNRYNPTAINNAYVYCLSDNYYAETNVAFAQTKLTDGTKYKYVAGTRLKDGTVYIDAALYDGEMGEPIESILVNTNLTQSEAEALGTNIIAYATVKGTGVNTTFTFTEPIIKN